MAGNANSGRRQEKFWYETLGRILKREDGDLPKRGKTIGETVVLTYVHKGLEGDVAILRDIADRMDGKPAQALVGGGEGDNPISLVARLERVIIDNAKD